jgi:hypothetical protein
MTQMVAPIANSSTKARSEIQVALYYCEKHGVMNTSSDLKEQVDQIVGKT